jgi:hypothetical protein
MTTNHGVHEGEWQTVGSKNSENEGGGGSPMQVAAVTLDNGDNRGRSMPPTSTTQGKIMECKAIMRRQVTSKSAL